MNKRSLDLLGKAFEADVMHALQDAPRLMQRSADERHDDLDDGDE